MSADTARPASAAEKAAILCRDEATAEFRAEGMEGANYRVNPPFEAALALVPQLARRIAEAAAGLLTRGRRQEQCQSGAGSGADDDSEQDSSGGISVVISHGYSSDHESRAAALASSASRPCGFLWLRPQNFWMIPAPVRTAVHSAAALPIGPPKPDKTAEPARLA